MMLDTSVIMASLLGERGGVELDARLGGSLVSIVNLTEVIVVSRRRGLDASAEEIEESLRLAGVETVAPTVETARLSASFMAAIPPKGYSRISIGDGYCLAHAFQRGVVALTADRAWAEMKFAHPVKIELIR